MKKFLALSLILGSFVFAAPIAEAAASATASVNVQQDRYYQQNRRGVRNNNRRYDQRRVRVVNQTRIVRVGRQRFRETIQIRYLPNGRTQTRVISRVRIR